MLNIYKFFVLFFITTFNANGELSEKIKNNIKFVCDEAIVFSGHTGHFDDPEEIFKAPPRHNVTLKKPIKKEDNLTIEYSVLCGSKLHDFPLTPNICDILDSQSDDDKTNLYKALIDLLGFNVSNCPIPEGTYKLKQNVFNSWLIDLFGSMCSETDDFFDNYRALKMDLMDGKYLILMTGWHQIKRDDTDNCTSLGSVIHKTIGLSFEPSIEYI